MADEVVSLFTLMDTELAKLNEVPMENDESNPGSSSVLPVPSKPRLGVPQFFPGNTPMKDFIAKQIANTLRPKEHIKQQDEEQKRLEEQIMSLKIEKKEKLRLDEEIQNLKLKEEQEYVIDLTAAIIPRGQSNPAPSPPQPKIETPAKNSPGPKSGIVQVPTSRPLIYDEETCLYKPLNPSLPCKLDMSYILKKKLKRRKFSNFGKVICAKSQPIYNISALHVHNYNIVRLDFKTNLHINNTVSIPMGPKADESYVMRFKFDTKSPSDIYLEQQEKQRIPNYALKNLNFFNLP